MDKCFNNFFPNSLNPSNILEYLLNCPIIENSPIDTNVKKPKSNKYFETSDQKIAVLDDSSLIIEEKKTLKDCLYNKSKNQNRNNNGKYNEIDFKFCFENKNSSECTFGGNINNKNILGNLNSYKQGNKYLYILTVKYEDKLISNDETNKKIKENNKKILKYIMEEIFGPLNNINLMIQLMENKLTEKMKEDYLIPISLSIRFLSNLRDEISYFHEILSITKINETVFTDFPLKTLILETINLFQYQFELRGLQVTLSFDPKIPFIINSNPAKIALIFINLLKNAIKNQTKSPILITIELEIFNIIKISVTDSGIGYSSIEKENILKTFDSHEINIIDPYNIGYNLFLIHILIFGLSFPNSFDKYGFDIISEKGSGSKISIKFEDKAEQGDLREDDNKIEGLSLLYKQFLNFEAKFLTKNDESKIKIRKSSASIHNIKNKKVSQTLISPVISINIPSQNKEVLTVSHKNMTFNNMQEKEIKEEVNTFQSSLSSKNNNTINIVSMNNVAGGKRKSFHSRLEEDISSFNCSRITSNIISSATSNVSLLKIINDLNGFEEKLRQIKEVNKQKGCNCDDILICDDDDLNLGAMKSVFQDIKFKILCLASIDELFEIINVKIGNNCCLGYKLIFINLKIIQNRNNICNLIQEIYLKNSIRPPSVIAILNNYLKDDISKCFDGKFSDYICKPISQQTIHYYIKKYIDVDLTRKTLICNSN